MEEQDKLLADKEVAVALTELQLEGYLEWAENGEDFNLTSAGIDYAWNVWKSLSPKDRTAVWCLMEYIERAVDAEPGD